MTDELLGDLVQYKTYKDKAVSTAAKSLIALFREKNPQMLHRRLRGKPTEATYEELEKIKQFGEVDAMPFIAGAEIIDALDNGVEDDKEVKRLLENGEDWEECSDEENGEEKKSNNSGLKLNRTESNLNANLLVNFEF